MARLGKFASWSWIAAVCLFTVCLAVLIGSSERLGVNADDSWRSAALASWEPLVLGIARHGLSELGSSAAQAVFAAPAADHGILLLLGAWARLSIGRLHGLSLTTYGRLPWLVLAALAPVFLLLGTRRELGTGRATLSAMLLAIVVCASATQVCTSNSAGEAAWAALIIASYSIDFEPARTHNACVGGVARALLAALGFACAITASLGCVWLGLACAVQFWASRWASVRASLRAGTTPIPASLLLALPVSGSLLFASNPVLWGAPPSAVVSRFFGASVSASNLPARGGGGFAFTAFAAPAWLVICAVLALGILGIVSFNPRAPAIGSRMHGLAVAALFLIAFVRLASPAAFDAFCPAAECSWPFLSLLVVLGFDAGGRLLRKTRS